MNRLFKALSLIAVTLFIVPSIQAGNITENVVLSDSVKGIKSLEVPVMSGLSTSGNPESDTGIMPDSSLHYAASDTVTQEADRTGSTDVLARKGKNALFLEMLGNSLNIISLNYERMISENKNIRIGGSYFGFSRKAGYEGDPDDLFVDLYSVPVSFSILLFDGMRQLELGMGTTFFSFAFWGGTYDVGYHDIDFGKNYKGIALTSVIGYRLSINDYLFRIGLSPSYMITLNSELSGFFEELGDRGIMDFRDWINFQGYKMIPGLSFGKTF